MLTTVICFGKSYYTINLFVYNTVSDVFVSVLMLKELQNRTDRSNILYSCIKVYIYICEQKKTEV